MISITERLRAPHEPVGDGTGTWRPDGLCQEAADITDALIDALEEAVEFVQPWERDQWLLEYDVGGLIGRLEAALSKAKGKHE